jgi:tRNA (guanosine-2'-O-)-methyltransferase
VTRSLTTTEIKRLNRQWRRGMSGSLSLALVSLHNPFNVGSIYRSAAAFGVDQVFLVGATPTPQDAKVRKTALGTEAGVATVHVDHLAEVATTVHDTGGQLVAVELAQGAVAIHEFDFASDVCLVLGSEAHGLPPSAIAQCDAAVYIAQPGKVASLNVATAASIAVHEVRRQAWTARPS